MTTQQSCCKQGNNTASTTSHEKLPPDNNIINHSSRCNTSDSNKQNNLAYHTQLQALISKQNEPMCVIFG